MEVSRDRLKRQCEWLRRNHNPLKLNDVREGLATDTLPRRSLLVTVDDAKIELLSVLDIFESFDIPICIFVCVGWSARETAAHVNQETARAALVANVQWYDGPPLELVIQGRRVLLGDDVEERSRVIDLVLTVEDLATIRMPPGGNLAQRGRKRICCSLDELADIASEKVAIGGHSISHIKLATASAPRIDYEIAAPRRILVDAIGQCDAFAYPYGMYDTYNGITDNAVKKAGYELAFLTHSDLATASSDPHQLPRISMPDRAMSDAEFRLRAAGAGIIYRKLKRLVLPHWAGV